jgi:transcriptional regulator with XRE-family HTH domain
MDLLHNEPLFAVGRNIRKRRELLKLSQQDLAERAGLDRSMIELIEIGQVDLLFDAYCNISIALETTPGALSHDVGISPQKH